MTKTLCIVPCGKAKIWDKKPEAGSTQARFVYTGSFAGKSIEYAQLAYPDSWVILSAKYGFLFPDDIIPGPYNISFNDKKTNPIKIKELKKQKIEKELYYDRIIVLGGKNYTKMTKECFRQAEIITPLAGCKGIGYMLQKLNKMIKEY